MNCVQLVADRDTQVLFHKATLQPVSPQPVLVYVPGAGLHVSASVELQEVIAGVLLQLVEVPMNGSFVLHHTNDFTVFSIICSFTKCVLHPTTRVTNEDVKQHWPHYQSLGSAITSHLPVRMWKVDHYTLNLIVWAASNRLCTPLIQSLPSPIWPQQSYGRPWWKPLLSQKIISPCSQSQSFHHRR